MVKKLKCQEVEELLKEAKENSFVSQYELRPKPNMDFFGLTEKSLTKEYPYIHWRITSEFEKKYERSTQFSQYESDLVLVIKSLTYAFLKEVCGLDKIRILNVVPIGDYNHDTHERIGGLYYITFIYDEGEMNEEITKNHDKIIKG